MTYISCKEGQVSLNGSLDQLIEFMQINNLLLGSYMETNEMDVSGSLGAYFINNSIQIVSYEQALGNKKYLEFYSDGYCRGLNPGLYRPFIYNDGHFQQERDLDSGVAMNSFPGLLKYTINFCHDYKTRLVKSNDCLKRLEIEIENNISVKEIDKRIGWQLFCNILNLKLDFKSLKQLNDSEILFDSNNKQLVAVKLDSDRNTIDPFIGTHFKLIEFKIIELGHYCDCEFEYTPELFSFHNKYYPVIIYYPHAYTVIDSAAKNLDAYLTSSMSHIL